LDGKYFAGAEDVIVVTVNYRVNIFGFPGAPGETQNLGLLDQRLAVEWLHENAKSFGGDPDRITISGQSSGSLSVDLWSYAYTEEPLVAGMISHSGTVFSFQINSEELATRHWYNASALLGCGSSGDVMPCMRKKPAEDIKAAITAIPPPPNTSVARSQPVFQPTPDGKTVFEDYATLSEEGKFAPIVRSLQGTRPLLPRMSSRNILTENP
jgi:cholinesterase